MITTIGLRNRSRGGIALRAGYTLVELLIAMGIGGIFLTGAMTSVNMLARSSVSVGHYANMNASSRRALEIFASDVRMAADVVTSTSTNLVFEAYDDTNTLVTVSYAYDASADEVYRTYDGTTSTILTEVDDFSLGYYDLTGASTTNSLSVKEVEIDASLIRTVLSLENTNEIISSRFMMRNRKVSS